MQACIEAESVKMGQTLIDRGMDFGWFEQVLSDKPGICIANDTFTALKQYWEASNPQAAQDS